MALLNINEFAERVEVQYIYCKHCHGIMSEIAVYRLDVLKFLFGKRKLVRRYKCPDCGQEKTSEF